jgi:hypothetical protein
VSDSDNDNRPAQGHSGEAADKAAESAPGERKPGEDLDQRQEDLVDEAVEETFPASDPISPKHIT